MKYNTRNAKLVKGSPNVYINKNDALSDETLLEKSSNVGRERLYQTVVFSTPVLASKRIHENQISSGKKLLYDDDDISCITNGIKLVSIGKGESKNIDDLSELKFDKNVEVKQEMVENSDTKVDIAKRSMRKAEKTLPQLDEGVGKSSKNECF